MEKFKLADMTKGWFVGAFSPAAMRTPDVEVAVKHYKSGDSEAAHFHKVATEITLILEGTAEMCGEQLSEGDIVKLSPGEITPFKAITDVTTVVVKMPSVPQDKFPA